MGRKKLTIQRLESMKARQAKYSKRKIGLLKKAKELSILCDVDLALVMFSPTAGKPTVYVGQNKDLSTVLERMSRLSVEEREERRAYTTKLLKKMYVKENSNPDSTNFTFDRNDALKLKEDIFQGLQEKLAEKSKILRDWKNPIQIDDLAQIKIMEDHLTASLNRIKSKKSKLQEQQKKHGASDQGAEDPRT